ncbi:hypothetical protein A0J57_23505 [Sphingobium sp. 22B]|nr:hypothetical protein AXW74_22205 [Sphingobium sp. AM]KYC29884.1 hypothetical protein A0J57_23505 [Sphingobium sp. 22B]OAP31567.1 hypothetical protein A8O16_13315 [Sphingobium sp. 20006FA]
MRCSLLRDRLPTQFECGPEGVMRPVRGWAQGIAMAKFFRMFGLASASFDVAGSASAVAFRQ